MKLFLLCNLKCRQMWFALLLVSLIDFSVQTKNTQVNCTSLRDNLAKSASEFIACAIYNARPVTLCENCVESLINMTGNYEMLKQSVDNETKCIDKFINLDRLQVVETLYRNSYDLWYNAKCDKCFQFVEGKLTPNKSTAAIKFYDYYQNFNECIKQAGFNDSTACSTCIDAYTQVDHFFVNISNENENIGGCMDIVDLMNTTRSLWSINCCKYRRHNESIFIGSTIVVLIMTLFFYVLVQFCSVKNSPIILQQRRFAESLSQSHTAHTT